MEDKEKTNNGYKVVNENKKGSSNVLKIIMLIVLVAFITFIITTFGMYKYFSSNISSVLKGATITSNGNTTQTIENKLNSIQSVINKYYLGEINEDDLIEGAISGYVEGLGDEYTEYISKDDMKEYTSEIMGNFTGIGIYLIKDTEANLVRVLAPIKNTPAEKAGILPGDYIKSVNGVVYTGDDLSIVSNTIKGESGTTVKLEIIRDGQTKEFEIKRENIKVNPVEGKVIENNIGYIEFTSFDEGTADEFKAKFEELQKQGVQSLIIDLRNNGGGIVEEATKIADYFANKDSVLLYELDKNNKEKVIKSQNDPVINMPIVILVNENTASSSEILAGALKDLNKATIVGKTTFGKGVIQQFLQLTDGSGLKITSEKYLTPGRNEINKIGITPDEEVNLPEGTKSIYTLTQEQDTQLQKAIEVLKK